MINKLALESLHQKKAFMSILASFVLGNSASRRSRGVKEKGPPYMDHFLYVLHATFLVWGGSGKKKSVEPGVVVYTHNSNICKEKTGSRIEFVSA